MFNFMIITVPADDLAPWGARPSAATVMTKIQVLQKYGTNT